ncbi:MAG: methyl-accepting chemotaxis protein [candidate division WOR-3 bacterium]
MMERIPYTIHVLLVSLAVAVGGAALFLLLGLAFIRTSGPWFLIIGTILAFFISLACSILVGLIGAGPTRRIIGETTGAMWSLAEGNLSFRMEEKGLGEEKAFRRHFNRATERLENLIKKVSEVSNVVHESVTQAAVAAEETGRSIQEQQDRIEASSAALGQVSTSVGEVAMAVQSATELSSEARGMASEGGMSVESITDKATLARESMDRLVEEVSRLERVAEEITGAIALINDISEETNLLSLNAAIEASRAGEAGRGFAVVADEIRNLAERSLNASKEVREVVEGVMTSLKDVVSRIQEASSLVQDLTGDIQGLRMTFHLISNSVEQVADKMLTVSTASEEQSQVITELTHQVSEVSRSGAEVASAAQELARINDEIKARMEELRRMLGEFLV